MAWILLSGLLAGLPAAAGPEPAAGMLLYAAPHLADPNFGQTVVLLVHYDDNGAQGLVINSPTQILASEALPEVDGIDRLKRPIFYGGPVQPERVLTLIRFPGHVPGGIRVMEDVHFTGSLAALSEALRRSRPMQRIRLFVGYAGWGPRQLDGEMARGDWIVERAEVATVFSEDPGHLWERVHQLRERIEVRRRDPRARKSASLDPVAGGLTK
jgi:putative transcriptional regulator